MVKLYIGVTDYDWFRFLSALLAVDEVNFWQPGGQTRFKALQPGELFLFKLHSPRDYIVGGGVFARASILPVLLAWSAFGIHNGATSLDEMRRRIGYYRREPVDPCRDYMIGCRMLEEPVPIKNSVRRRIHRISGSCSRYRVPYAYGVLSI